MLETVITSAIVAVLTATVTGIITFLLQERKLRADLRTEFMAERALLELLQCPNWKKRTFEEINKRIGGFGDDELRKLLVRAGAVRFQGDDGKELWGLVTRNKDSV